MRALRDPDAFPSDDPGLGMPLVIARRLNSNAAQRRGGYAAMLLWQSSGRFKSRIKGGPGASVAWRARSFLPVHSDATRFRALVSRRHEPESRNSAAVHEIVR